MSTILYSFIVAAGSILFPLFIFQDEEWELAVDEDGIKVYTKPVEGSQMDATKTVLDIHASIEEVEEALRDVESHKEWMHTVTKSKVLERVSEDEFHAYYLADAPWPVSNRDIISHYKIQTQPSGAVLFDVGNAPDQIPEKEGIVRIENATSSWQLTPRNDGYVNLIYRYHADPGGSVPSWLANQAVTDTPFKTVRNLRERLEGE